MKKKNRLYTILAVFLVMTMALFLTPAAFAADDDLGPLIPSEFNPDHPDYLPPLIPKDPPGKEPPTRPPIEIEVPDDGEDLDLVIDKEKLDELLRALLGAWTITIDDYETFVDEGTPHLEALSLYATKIGDDELFGTYTGESTMEKNYYTPDFSHLRQAIDEPFSFELLDISTLSDDDLRFPSQYDPGEVEALSKRMAYAEFVVDFLLTNILIPSDVQQYWPDNEPGDTRFYLYCYENGQVIIHYEGFYGRAIESWGIISKKIGGKELI